MRITWLRSFLATGVAVILAAPLFAAKSVLFIAGLASHGFNEHEHPQGAEVLARCLNDSGLGLEASVSPGWPADPAAAARADVIVLYSDGGEDHVARGRVGAIRAWLGAGKGLAVLHFALEPSDNDMARLFHDAIGGAFEVGWSVNPVWDMKAPQITAHPVTRGVALGPIRDEWYFHLRFDERVTPLLQALPPPDVLGADGPRSGNPAVRQALAAGRAQTLAWVVENDDGSRGFGFTGGHFHHNWAAAGFRTLVLNGIAWAAGADIPDHGVPSAAGPIPRNQSIDVAIARGDLDDVRRHIAADPSRLQTGERSLTPLQQAILRKQTAIALYLLEAGADPDKPDSARRSPVHLAVERQLPDVLRALLKRGANPDMLGQTGWTPLHHAAAGNKIEMVKILLAGGADPMTLSERGGTPLHEAAASGGPEIVRLLLDAGVDPAVVSRNDDTALEVARRYKNEAVIPLLESACRK